MTTQEFSNELDIFYNNISSNASPGLNEYEKSVILTKAQLEILRNYFNPKGNKYQEGFDDSAKRQVDFSKLITIAKPEKLNTLLNSFAKFDERSIQYNMPTDILYMLNEMATIKYDGMYTHKVNVVPISYAEYSIFMSRPFKNPYKQQVWRLTNSPQNYSSLISELITKDGTKLTDYVIRYVRMPKPIILIDLDVDTDFGEEFSGLSVQGFTKKTECELDQSIHHEILQRAVELAKGYYTGDLTLTQLGQRSE